MPVAHRSRARSRCHLQSRSLRDPASPDLLFNPDLTDFETRRGWPGMVAQIRNGAGEPTGGIHRTYLLDDGSGKAPPGKKMLGPVAGGSVRLSAVGRDGHLGIAEGIETALSAQAIFGVPTWAALSADGLRRWQWPNGINRITIFADAGDAARRPPPLWPIGSTSPVSPTRSSPRCMATTSTTICVMARRRPTTNRRSRRQSTRPPPQTPLSEFEAAARALTNPPDLTILGSLLGQLVMARLEPLPERQVLAAIKTATGIAVSILEKQICELRRRLNTTGNIHHRPIRPRWANQLRLDLVGTPERNEANVITALSNDEAFAGAMVFDEFRQEILIARALPWDQHSVLPRPWSDADDVRCAEWLQHREINVGPATVSRGINAVARDIAFTRCAIT